MPYSQVSEAFGDHYLLIVSKLVKCGVFLATSLRLNFETASEHIKEFMRWLTISLYLLRLEFYSFIPIKFSL